MIINIQMLRFLAALAVLMAHMSALYQGMAGEAGPLSSFNGLGRAGVDIFFVISGFIMWSTTVNYNGGRQAGKFILRRFARIYSGYWPFFLIFLVTFYFMRPAKLESVDLLHSFLLIPQSLNTTLIIVSWTLYYELYFYVLIALLLLLPRSLARKVLVAIAITVVAVAIYRYQVFRPIHFYTFSYLNFMSSPLLLEFLAGCLAWELIYNTRFAAYKTVLAAGVVLMLAGGWFNAEVMGDVLFQGFHVPERVAIFGLAAFMIVLGLVGLERQGFHPKGKLFLYLGGASYALYLSHLWFVGAFSIYFYQGLKNIGEPLASLAYLAVILVIVSYSVVHYLWIEKPLYKLFKRVVPGHA